MALSVNDFEKLKKAVLEEADTKYVHVSTCNDLQKQNNNKFANDDVRIKLFEQKMSTWEWMFKLIATGTVGTLVTSVLSLILK
jgi:hypothetical protein